MQKQYKTTTKMKTTKTKLSQSDKNVIACTFDNNNLSVQISSIAKTLNLGITEVDTIIIENKKLQKDIIKLKKLLAQSELISANINSLYFNSL